MDNNKSRPKVDLTYGGKLRTLINVLEDRKLNVNYTIDGVSGKTTTTSILIRDDEKDIDREKLYQHYGVSSNGEMTLEQLRDAKKKLENK